MKLLQVTVVFFAVTLFSSCVFMPSMVMGAKKGIDSVKDSFDGLDDLEIEWDSTEVYSYEDDSMNLNEAPTTAETFDFYEIECLEASLYLDKMNVIYVGVDNPCRIFVTNVPNQHIEIETTDNIEVIVQEGGFYTLRASKPGEGSIYVIAGGYEQEYQIQIKGIPNPTIKLGTKKSGEITGAAFKANDRVSCWLEDFDFDTRCAVESFSMTRITQNGVTETIENIGGSYREAAETLKDKAQTGDIYLFENIKQRCPGDSTSRSGNSLVFRIK